ncbi:MAG: TRAP transporter substrate-binding protein [Desulfopila sp.]
MKKYRAVAGFVTLVMVSLVSLAGCSGDDEQKRAEGTTEKKVVELKMHHHEAAGNVLDTFFHEWAKRVEQDANGTLKITIFPGASLGGPKTALDMLNTGICDIAWTFSGFHPGQFTLTDAISLPMLNIKNAKDGTTVLNKMFYQTDYISSEFEGYKVLWMNTNAQNPIVTKNKKIEKLEDLKNLAIRIPGGPPTDFAIALGYSPISMGPGDIFSSMEKNVIEGYVIDWGGIENFKLYEISNYYLSFNHYEMPFYCMMNQEKFDSLPAEAKAALEKNSGTELALEVAAIFDATYQNAIVPEVTKRGSEIVTLSESETAKFRDKAQSVWSKWIEENSKKGYPAQEVFDKYVEFAQQLQ